MKKILIIPSWYPTDNNWFLGSFFREQARIFENEFEIYILYGLPRYFSFSRLLKFRRFTPEKLLTPPAGILFYYPQIYNGKILGYFPITQRIIDRINYLLIKNAFQVEFEKLIYKGFSPDLIHSHSILWGGIAEAIWEQGIKYPPLLPSIIS